MQRYKMLVRNNTFRPKMLVRNNTFNYFMLVRNNNFSNIFEKLSKKSLSNQKVKLEL